MRFCYPVVDAVVTGLNRVVGVGLLIVSLCVRAADRVPPCSETDLRNVIATAETVLEAASAQETANRLTVEQEAARTFETMSLAELKAHFAEPAGHISARECRGWTVARQLAIPLLKGQNAVDARNLAEVLEAIQNGHRRPIPATINCLQPPVLLWEHLHHPIARGRMPATNLVLNSTKPDLSLVDPAASTFWRRPPSIASQDLFAGFGRPALPRYETNLWEYAGPKTSWGTWPGFDLRCGDLEIKVKLAETHSEPFTGRIFHALGFHAEATDYAAHLKIKYARRLFREFHLRKDLSVEIRAPGLRMYTFNFQKRYDPFRFIAEAVLKDGRRMTGKELKTFLLSTTDRNFPEDDSANFRTENEALVDYVVTAAANVQLQHTAFKAIGPWRFEGLDHEHLRELRGAGLLGAWLGWNDSRFENTRLKICETNGQMHLAHFFTDLGSGLGESAGVIPRPKDSPERFPDTFTAPTIFRGKGRMTTPFRIRNFEPIEPTPAFAEMTVDDARWMARLIAQLTYDQLVQALTASGFNPPDVGVYTAKLVARRDNMIRDLDLASEISPLRPKR